MFNFYLKCQPFKSYWSISNRYSGVTLVPDVELTNPEPVPSNPFEEVDDTASGIDFIIFLISIISKTRQNFNRKYIVEIKLKF